MTCDEADELLGAYALDALPEADRRLVDAHLRGCAAHAEAAAELRAIAERLPDLAEQRTPPAMLRGRTLDAIAAEGRRGADARRFEPRSALPGWRSIAGRPLTFRTWGAAAAIFIAAIIGLSAWNIVLQRRVDSNDDAGRLASRITSVATLRATGGSGAGGTVLYFAGQNEAVVVGDGLPGLDSANAYQLWSVNDGKAESLGLMRGSVAVVRYEAGRGRTLAITVEPASGSAQPSSPPLYAVEL